MALDPTILTELLIADAPAAGPTPTPTLVNGDPVSAILELQSTTQALLLPRMTTVERDEIEVPYNGMMIYNTSTNSINSYENSAWGASGGGDVDGPGSSSNQGLAVFNGITGKLLAATTVLLNPATSIISGLASLVSASGTAAAPAYTFTNDDDTGLYRINDNELGVATDGALQFSVSGAATSVNHLRINGSATGSALTMTAVGTDPNISIVAVPKGTGQFFNIPGTAVNPSYTFTGGGGGGSGMFYSTGTAQTSYVGFSNANTGFVGLNGNGVLSLGSTTFDATANKCLAILAGTAPTGVANVLQIYGATVGGHIGTLGLSIPAASVIDSVAIASKAVEVQINGATYYLLATQTP